MYAFFIIAKDIRISHAKFYCSRFTTLQDIQDCASLIFGTHYSCNGILIGIYTRPTQSCYFE